MLNLIKAGNVIMLSLSSDSYHFYESMELPQNSSISNFSVLEQEEGLHRETVFAAEENDNNKRSLIQAESSVAKKRKTDCEEELKSASAMELELGEDISQVMMFSSLEELKMNATMACTQSANEEDSFFNRWQLLANGRDNFWVEVRTDIDLEKSIFVFMQMKETTDFFSEAFDSSCFPKSAEEGYRDIRAFESIGVSKTEVVEEDLIFNIRVGSQANELVWYQKGRELSGDEVGNVLKSIEILFGAPTYLYDDAKVQRDPQIWSKENAAETYNLRMLQLWKKSSLYQRRFGYELAECDKSWKMGAKQKFESLEQNPQEIAKAYEYVAEMKLKDFHDLYKKYPNINKVENAVKFAFNNTELKMNNSVLTIGQFQKALQDRIIELKDISKEEHLKALKIQKFIYEHLFTNWIVQKDAKDADYWHAIHKIANARVYIKSPILPYSQRVFSVA